ncbi:hypothetical protein PG999_008544 [Apiospora kogelbergensis]|uniref:Uncharacterized protein n=1 Tax=Apiospora kogelbergensis TaxID=1337665 RepID=A0AAW0QGN6_9PEZI
MIYEYLLVHTDGPIHLFRARGEQEGEQESEQEAEKEGEQEGEQESEQGSEQESAPSNEPSASFDVPMELAWNRITPPPSTLEPAILRLNRQTKWEGSGFLYAHNRFGLVECYSMDMDMRPPIPYNFPAFFAQRIGSYNASLVREVITGQWFPVRIRVHGMAEIFKPMDPKRLLELFPHLKSYGYRLFGNEKPWYRMEPVSRLSWYLRCVNFPVI